MTPKAFKRGIQGVFALLKRRSREHLRVSAPLWLGSLGPDSWDGGELKGLFGNQPSNQAAACRSPAERLGCWFQVAQPEWASELWCGSPKKDMRHMPMSVRIRIVCCAGTECKKFYFLKSQFKSKVITSMANLELKTATGATGWGLCRSGKECQWAFLLWFQAAHASSCRSGHDLKRPSNKSLIELATQMSWPG